MTPERVIELAGHRQVPPWVMKLVMDAISDEQEPVAWMDDDKWFTRNKDAAKKFGGNWTPLYAAPVRTKDLTDGEKLELARSSVGKSRHWLVEAAIAADREKNRG